LRVPWPPSGDPGIQQKKPREKTTGKKHNRKKPYHMAILKRREIINNKKTPNIFWIPV